MRFELVTRPSHTDLWRGDIHSSIVVGLQHQRELMSRSFVRMMTPSGTA
jgi:hypothetical protein